MRVPSSRYPPSAFVRQSHRTELVFGKNFSTRRSALNARNPADAALRHRPEPLKEGLPTKPSPGRSAKSAGDIHGNQAFLGHPLITALMADYGRTESYNCSIP